MADKQNNFTIIGFLLIPITCAVLALMGYGYLVHVAVPVTCILIIGLLARKPVQSNIWLLIFALIFSILGDWMLIHRNGDSLRFVYGIALFFIAHVGFFVFCLKNGKIQGYLLTALVVGYGLFFVFKLMPAISETSLFIATLAYTLISCLSAAASFGLHFPPVSRWLFFTGMASILFSDTLIALHEFLNVADWCYSNLMMPTYYAAHILVTASILKNKYSLSNKDFDVLT
jgi:uncharacterized membrane protein YhhN